MFEIFKWAVAAASLVGVVLNIQRRRSAFGIWLCTNTAWAVVDTWHGVYPQACLQAALSVYGLYQWRKPDGA
jgi:hypothetical protein